MTHRRDFIKNAALGTLGFSLLPGISHANVLGANERLLIALIGVHSRGKALTKGIHSYSNARIVVNCDVDKEILSKHSQWCQENIGYIPEEESDFRRVLENKDIDAVFIATPDHWHAPIAIEALKAGKHVYVEKPCSHNPYENELLVAAQRKYGKKVQMGSQTRASERHKVAITQLRNNIIGNVYRGEAFYTNNRPTIGHGQIINVPESFNWDLWQGPAPRQDYRDNIHPYNWHWFKKWGTGEVCNNGLHEIDILRWALDLDLPNKVTSIGGNYTYEDDWEYPDNQEVIFEFNDNKYITYTGHSRGKIVASTDPQAIVYGSKGAMVFGLEDFMIYDLDGKPIGKNKDIDHGVKIDTVGGGSNTDKQAANFFDAIRKDEKLNSPIVDGAKSTLLCHYGNISQQVNRVIKINKEDGKIIDNPQAMSLWKREYEPGWEPKI